MGTRKADIGWKVQPFPPKFWRRNTVQALCPQLSYFGPLPQTNTTTEQIVELWPYAAYVYIIQGVEGDVLYVGKTINPVGRLASHRARKDWWPDSGMLTLLGVEAEDRIAADALSLRLESLAIRDCVPLHNIAGVRR